jgi:hypothetical protein
MIKLMRWIACMHKELTHLILFINILKLYIIWW